MRREKERKQRRCAVAGALAMTGMVSAMLLLPGGKAGSSEQVWGIPMEAYLQEKAAEAREEAELTRTHVSREVYSLSDESREMLLKIVMAEAGGEDLEGKCLVLCVIMNRIRSKDFPDTVAGVVFEPGQFSPVSDGRYYDMVPDEQCYIALEMVSSGWDESQGATYFRTDIKEENWHTENLQKLFVHGNHAFFKEA